MKFNLNKNYFIFNFYLIRENFYFKLIIFKKFFFFLLDYRRFGISF
jgi:hypothetical protein